MRKPIDFGPVRRVVQFSLTTAVLVCWLSISTAFALVAAPGTFSKEAAWDDNGYFHFRTACANSFPHLCVFIDNDDNPATGYIVGSIGADYMIEDSKLFHYEGASGTGWKWNSGIPVVLRSQPEPNTFEFAVSIGLLGSPSTASVVCQGLDNSSNATTDPTTVRFVQGASASSGGGGGSSAGGSLLPAAVSPGGSGFSGEQASDDGVNFYFRATCSFMYPHFQVLIDTRTNGAMGLSVNGIAADYMIQDDKLYRYSRSATGEPEWGAGDPIVVRSAPAPNVFEFAVPLTALGSPSTAKVIFQGVDGGGNTVSDPVLTTFVRGRQSELGGSNAEGPIDDSLAGWIFSGMTEVDDDGCKSGMEHAGGPSTYAAYTFNGSGVDIYAMTGPTIEVQGRTHKLGRMRILIDGKSDGIYSLSQTSVTYQSKVYSVTGLTRGNHVLQLEADSGWIDIDFIQVSHNE